MLFSLFLIKFISIFNIFSTLFFLFLCIFTVIFSCIIILARNPMHSVFALILSFSTIILIMLAFLQCEFLSIIFLIVYVGAVSILFLFIVMLLNIRNIDLTDQFFNYFPVGIFIGFIFLVELNYYIFDSISFTFTNLDIYFIYLDFINNIDAASDITLISYMLYEEYFIVFILASILLLIAMIGAIMLTLRNVIEVKTQLIYSQVYRVLVLKSF